MYVNFNDNYDRSRGCYSEQSGTEMYTRVAMTARKWIPNICNGSGHLLFYEATSYNELFC